MTISRSRPYPTPVLETGASLVATARLVLAGIVLVAYLIDVPGKVYSTQLTHTVIAGYLLFAAVLYAAPQALDRLVGRSQLHWVDVGWYALLTAVTDPGTSGIFMFFLFAVLSASFRHGTRAGLAITAGSVASYLAIVFLLSFRYPVMEWAALILRSLFLISLGLMISYWGGKELSLKRRLALLREINALSNPRFGMEQALLATMSKFRSFFAADTCIVLLHDPEHDRFILRESKGDDAPPPQVLPTAMARLLHPFDSGQGVSFGPVAWHRSGTASETRLFDMQGGAWSLVPDNAGASVAEILGTRAFISVPLQAGKDAGRLYLCSRQRRFRHSEVAFLAQATEQAFRLIEHVKILDRMATAAAAVERQRIVTDLHDTAVQPYIGLKMGLEALQAEAGKHHPLAGSIERLVSMTGAVIGDLRSFVHNLEQHRVAPANILFANLRERARHFAEHFGVRVELDLPERLQLSDRLAAEVLQLVNEGLSNVRKHTVAQVCRIRMERSGDMLNLDISNPVAPGKAAPAGFVPRSITQRAAALGGTAEVSSGAHHTSVRISIPI